MSCKVCYDYDLQTDETDFIVKGLDEYGQECKYLFLGGDVYQAKFCPNCGKPLTAAKPLTLDELRERDGRPVWTEYTDGSGGCWGLVYVSADIFVAYSTKFDPDGPYSGCARWGTRYEVDWIAFDHPPETSAE